MLLNKYLNKNNLEIRLFELIPKHHPVSKSFLYRTYITKRKNHNVTFDKLKSEHIIDRCTHNINNILNQFVKQINEVNDYSNELLLKLILKHKL